MLRVAITSGDDIALPDEFGMDIHPATANNFGLQQVNQYIGGFLKLQMKWKLIHLPSSTYLLTD